VRKVPLYEEKEMSEFLQFRFVPTMRCNFKCSYCFLPHSLGGEPTMFDDVAPSEWVRAMGLFSDYEVEFYMWGGEPFCLDGTFEVVKGFAEYDFVKWARIDSNISAAKKIANRCPSEKVKINCSWHTEYFKFDDLWQNVMRLNERGMVGMVNFVASDANLARLEEERMTLDELIQRFQEKEIFVNVSADFGKGNDPEYKELICRYTTEADWDHIHYLLPPKDVECNAGRTFFTVGYDGTLTSCGVNRRRFLNRTDEPADLGNFFAGRVTPKTARCPQKSCPSIVSYAHREDNEFAYKRHLEDYVDRNRRHRLNIGTE